MGESVPARDHAVCVSLPTVEDLIGYEEKHPHTLEKIKRISRFVQHNLLGKLERCLRESKDDGSSKLFSLADLEMQNCLRIHWDKGSIHPRS